MRDYRRWLRMPLPGALIAAGIFLLHMETTHQGLPLWANLTFTLGFMALLNGMAAAIDVLGEFAKQAIAERTEED